MLTGYASIETAVKAVQAEAADDLSQPRPIAEAELRIPQAPERGHRRRRAELLEGPLSARVPGPSFVGGSPVFRTLMATIERAAASDANVLLCGETGSGKGAVARMLHARSDRRDRPFVLVECASLQEDFLQNELFGHDRGAFTGAVSAKVGLFEVAHRGTLFLDDVGELGPATQAKLLRVLDDRSFRHLGGTGEICVDVRVLSATNRDLNTMAQAGSFRADLLYRLQSLRIDVPSLREREGDVELLARHFLAGLNRRYATTKRFAAQTIEILARSDWPGNVRQLINEVECAHVMSAGDVIGLEHVCVDRGKPEPMRSCCPTGGDPPASLAEVERCHIERVLRFTGGHRAKAAKILGIGERSLYRILLKHGLSV